MVRHALLLKEILRDVRKERFRRLEIGDGSSVWVTHSSAAIWLLALECERVCERRTLVERATWERLEEACGSRVLLGLEGGLEWRDLIADQLSQLLSILNLKLHHRKTLDRFSKGTRTQS